MGGRPQMAPCGSPQVSVARSAEALQRSLKTSDAQLVSLENCQGERVVSWDFWVWKWSTPQKLMDLMVWSSSSLFKMAFWLGLWAFFCLSERRSPVKLAIWWYNLCCFPQFSSSFPVFPPFYPCFPPVSPHFPWHFPWWFPCASPSEDLRLAEASLEELLRHGRHTAFYKAGAELPKPH